MIQINKLDENRKKDFSTRLKSTLMMIGLSLIIILFAILSDPRHKENSNEWNKDSSYDGFAFFLPKNVNFVFALILFIVLFLLIFQISKELESCYLKTGTKRYTIYIFLIISISFLLPSSFMLFVTYFGKTEKWWNIDSGIYAILFGLSGFCLIPLTKMIKRSSNTSKFNNICFPAITLIISFFFSAILYFIIIRGIFTLLCLLFICFMCDGGGYVFGIFFGKHKMAPKISPKKTWEGLAGSYICSIIFVCLILFLFGLDNGKYQLQANFLGNQWDKYAAHNKGILPNSVGWWFLIISIILFFSTISIFGDLAFSLMKRKNGIKDFSNIIKGHGGILDRIDSWVFVVSFFFVFSLLISLISTCINGFNINRIFNYFYINK